MAAAILPTSPAPATHGTPVPVLTIEPGRSACSTAASTPSNSVRIVLIIYPPRADSDLHLNIGPEITAVQDGELTVYAQGRREVLQAGAAHWLPDGTAHLARNEGDRPVRFWSLLLKRCD